MKGKTIIIINGQPNKNYLLGSLKKHGFSLINLVTPTSTISYEDMLKQESYYDSIVTVENSISEALDSLKHLFKTREYSFSEVLATQQIDVELADLIQESFAKPFNGEAFRSLNRDKTIAINRLNKFLQVDIDIPAVLVEEFVTTMEQQTLPCSVKVISQQQTIATYLINKPSDIEPVFTKLHIYKASDIRVWVQPYHQNLYRLQTSSFRNEALAVALWHEKTFIRKGEVWEDMQALINPKESDVISQEKLALLSQQLVENIYLSHGIAEFVLAFDKNKVLILDYNLTIPNPNKIEVMERVVGYSPLSYHLMRSGLATETSLPKKEFKNIVAVNLFLNSKNDLLKLSVLPTFYRYYADKIKTEDVPSIGELYLVHKNKYLVMASYASIHNLELLLLDPQFALHSATHIVDFYREAAFNKRTDYKLNEEEQSLEEEEALKHLDHESQHITRYIKPLDSKANIQDIMRYYIDIYDLYILHGKPPGTEVIAMNTGNPAFLPFSPIIKALRKSLQENLLSYARYSMQVPETSFIDKITRYCQEEQILLPQQKLQTNNVIIGHGSTNLYYLALKSVIKNKGDIVLITRPTYGLFIDPVYTAGGDVGFIDIKESVDWKVQPQNLHKTIHFYNEAAFNNYILTIFLKKYKIFLHAQKVFHLEEKLVPPMPNLESITNLRVFDDYITKLNAYIDNIENPLVNKDELRFSFPPRVRAFYHMNPHNPTGATYTKQDLEALAEVMQAHPDIYVIDDLAHWGVLYGAIEPSTFSSINNMFEKTLTLISLSKSYCVPGLRTGVAIGNAAIISEMQYRLLNSSSSATLPAMIALDAVFSASKEERDHYLHNNSQEYLFRRNLMSALVNGIQQIEMTLEHKIKFYQLILENEYKEGQPVDKKFLNIILSGMPLVQTLTEPKGCFFHLLDISKLIGATVGHGPILQTSTDVRNAIYSICKIDTVPGEISGNFFNYSLRMSFSLTPQKIYNACKSIHLFIGNYIIKHNPSILTNIDPVNSSYLQLPEVVDEIILNKSLIRLYLNRTIQSLTTKHTQLFTLNYLQNKLRLQAIEQKIMQLNMLEEKLLDQSFEQTVHKEIHDYLLDNEIWIQNYLPELEELKIANQAGLNASTDGQILTPRSIKLRLRAC